MRRVMGLRAIGLCGLAVLLPGWFSPTLRAQERAARPGAAEAEAIAKLLEVGWGDSFRAIEPAREHFEQAKAAAPRDPRVPLAFALVHIKHNRPSDAAKLLDEALSLDRRHVAAREARL